MVLTAATPRYTVQYGTFVLDDTNGIRLTSEPDSSDSSLDGSYYVEFEVRIVTPSGDEDNNDSQFATLCQNVENYLTIPRQKFVAQVGGHNLRNWDWAGASQTAIMILPELSLKWSNARIAHYGFRVRCQFPGRIPNNAFRRESLSSSVRRSKSVGPASSAHSGRRARA